MFDVIGGHHLGDCGPHLCEVCQALLRRYHAEERAAQVEAIQARAAREGRDNASD